MKSTHIFLSFLIGTMMLTGCNQTPKVPDGEFLIEGELTDVPDSTIINLSRHDRIGWTRVASDTVIGGVFRLKDTLSSTLPLEYNLNPENSGFPSMGSELWLASGTYVKITGSGKLHPLWKIESDVAEQKDQNGYMSLCPTERALYLQLQAQERDLFKVPRKNRDWHKIDSLRSLYMPLEDQVQLAELNYMKEAPVSRVWLEKYKSYVTFLHWNDEFGHQDLIRSLYDRMSDVDKASEAGKEIYEYLHLPEKVNVGDDMADGDLYDLEGKVRHLSEFKGKYILVDFWASWCPPCRSSIPELEEIIKQYAGKMEVVSINQDTKDAWKSFVAEKGLNGNQWNELRSGNTGLAAAYQVRGIPHYVMISPEGKVESIWEGYAPGTLKAKVKELVK